MKRRDLLKGMLASTAMYGMPGPVGASSPVILPTTDPRSKAQESTTQDSANQESKGSVKPVDELVTPKTAAAIERGLRFLADRQIVSGPNAGAFGTSGYASGPAVTALAGLAFLCNGSTPFDGPFEANIRRSTRFLLRNTSDRGYITTEGNRQSNMYGHGYAMLYLSQVYGMSGSHLVEEKLQLAIDMTCKVQNSRGGWRYQPTEQTGDLSITICQVMALRAAHNAGLFVPKEVRDKTLDYVYKSQKDDGSFQYTLSGGRVSLALTAAGVVSLYSAGIYEGEEIEKALGWLNQRRPTKSHRQSVSPMNYFYAHYYAVQAMWHAQLKHPDYWNAWYPAIRDELLGLADGGTWRDARVCSEFATAMACIILQIPFNYVPVFAP